MRGFGFSPVGILPPNFRGKQGWEHVTVPPSRFVLMGEVGSERSGRLSLSGRDFHDVWEGWWHGSDTGQLAMLDGSSIVVQKMRSPSTSRYTFFMDPAKLEFPRGLTLFPELTFSAR